MQISLRKCGVSATACDACERHLLLLLLGAADVRVGAQQDVLQLRLLLVDVLDGLAIAAAAGGVGRRPQGAPGLGRGGSLGLRGGLDRYRLDLRLGSARCACAGRMRSRTVDRRAAVGS